METLAFVHSCGAYEDQGLELELKSFEELGLTIPNSAWIGLAGTAVALSILNTAPDAHAAVKRGDACKEVVDIQEALIDNGHNPGGVDGVFGGQTEYAVLKFQQKKAIKPADGIVGVKTAELLGLGDASNANSPYLPNKTCKSTGNTGNPGNPGNSGGTSSTDKPGTYTVTASNGLYIRSQASSSASILGTLGYGQTVKVTDKRKTANGITWAQLTDGGWVAANYLSVGGGNNSGGGTGSGSAGTFTVVASSGLLLRSAPTVNSDVLGSYGYGETVSVTTKRQSADGYTWAQVSGGGWIAADYLTAGGTSTPGGGTGSGSTGTAGTFTVVASSGLILRSSPSLAGDSIGSYGYGDTVSVTSARQYADGYTWAQVSGGGWVAADYLTVGGGDSGGGTGSGSAGTYTVGAGSGLVVRSSPSVYSDAVGSYGNGDAVYVTSARAYADGYTWAQLPSGNWVAADFLY
ncbi:MAG: SH3 domain-containing protein [Scytolyngbya sp. HA4215-MV1]|jgi:uncharacterized protein YgiM (DUF1202 family)|nr:SH3 domain-containing protein [Scytolyngbya sp. HA4215-MV1]